MSKIIVRLLQFIPPKIRKKRDYFNLEAKKEFYAMPLEVQLYYRQFNPALEVQNKAYN